MEMILFFYIAFSILAGVYANGRGRSFTLYFLFALLFSPLISFITIAVTANLKADSKIDELLETIKQQQEIINK